MLAPRDAQPVGVAAESLQVVLVFLLVAVGSVGSVPAEAVLVAVVYVEPVLA